MMLSIFNLRKRTVRTSFAAIIAVLVLFAGVVSVDAQTNVKTNSTQSDLALEGYCPVCIIEMEKWVRGKLDHQTTYDGKVYYFPSEKQKKMFLAAPAKYVPALGGDCTVCLAKMGKHDSNEIPWQPYSHDLLSKYTAAGKTVFVDFTADWCLTCKANEAAAINQEETRRFVAANDIVMLKADKTQPAPEVDELLRRLGNKAASIPYYAVFPAGNPNKPILVDGILTSPKPILDAMRKGMPKAAAAQHAEVGSSSSVTRS